MFVILLFSYIFCFFIHVFPLDLEERDDIHITISSATFTNNTSKLSKGTTRILLPINHLCTGKCNDFRQLLGK